MRARIGPLLLLVASAVVLLANLGTPMLWQDEAQTALISETVLAHGVPLGTDGKNFFSQEKGAEYGPGYLWRWHTWFPFYFLAAFFAVLGKSTLVARLPFALLGVATVVAVYFFGGRVWSRRRAGIVAGVLLLSSVPFLILSRQCRYYSAAMLFSVLGLHAYLRMLDRDRRAPFVFAASAFLLFQTHYVYFAALFAAVLVDLVLFHRDAWRRVGIASAAGTALCLPWVVWLSGMSYGARYSNLLDPARAQRLATAFARLIGKDVFPWLLLAVPLGLVLVPWRRPKRAAGDAPWRRSFLLLAFMVANLAILSVSAPAPFFRYLAPLLPVCAVLMAGVIEAATARQVWVGSGILAALVLWQPLASYAYEVTHDFRGPVEGLVEYLSAHAKPGDVVAITYEDLPLKFYTELRVLGGLTGEDLSRAPDARFVVVRKNVISSIDLEVRNYLVQNVPWQSYRQVEIDAPDTPFQNRESPEDHLFRTAQGVSRVVLFERVAP